MASASPGRRVELMAYGSLRLGETLALRVKHVDVLGCKLVVAESLTEVDGKFSFGPTKNHQVREVRLPRGLLGELSEHLDSRVPAAPDALVFTGSTGEPLHYTSVRRSFDAACRRVGLIGVTPHSLRASCASWVAESDGVVGGSPTPRAQPVERDNPPLRSPHGRWRCGGCRPA